MASRPAPVSSLTPFPRANRTHCMEEQHTAMPHWLEGCCGIKKKKWPHVFCYRGLLKCHVCVFQWRNSMPALLCEEKMLPVKRGADGQIDRWRNRGSGRKCVSDVHGKVDHKGLLIGWSTLTVSVPKACIDTTCQLKHAETSVVELMNSSRGLGV